MKLDIVERQVTTGGDLGIEIDYTIRQEHLAKIMWMLRTGLYTRKALAVCREYASNGWDEHKIAGVTRPLLIHVPQWGEPYFSCRDYGRGLSRYGVRIFAEYGTSTKDGALPKNCPECAARDDATLCSSCAMIELEAQQSVGALGIGSKSGFCIGDTFTVTSWHGGTKAIYSAAIGPDNKGKLTLMYEEDCGDETGIEVSVPVPTGMVYEFEREARWLYQHMAPQPEINIPLPIAPTSLNNGYLRADDQGTWIGIMGCVPYRINLEQIQEPLSEEGLWEPLQKLGGALYLPLGSVEFAINREELQHTKRTNAVLAAAFRALVDEYLEDAIKSLKGGKGSGWDRRHKAVFLSNGLGLRLPKRFDKWTQKSVPLFSREKGEGPVHFTMLSSSKSKTTEIPVCADTRLLIHDPKDTRKMKGWSLHSYDIIIVPLEGHTMEQAKVEIIEMLSLAMLDGVGIGLMTERTWHIPASEVRRSSRGRGSPNAKHRNHTFLMTGRDCGDTLSRNWKIVEPPEDEHCYFIIHRFQHQGKVDFYHMVKEDMALAKAFGLTFPPIYGYKSTMKRHVDHSDISNGTTYTKWRKQFFRAVMTPKVKTDIHHRHWSRLFRSLPYHSGNSGSPRSSFRKNLPQLVKDLAKQIGSKHPIVRYFKAYMTGRKRASKFESGYPEHLDRLYKMFPGRSKQKAPQRALDLILAAYPMLRIQVTDDNDMHMFATHTIILCEYINDTDRAQS